MDDHALSKDDTIYLKDLNQVASHEDEKTNVYFYTDDSDDVSPV